LTALLFTRRMINLHVLFADDDADVREVVTLSLERDPFFVVRGCASGREALAAATEWRPDLALLDVRMPGMDGPSVLAHLRADARTAAIPVVFVTAGAKPQECSNFKTLGAAGVISKPFNPSDLAAELRRFVPAESSLAAARENFLLRLDADAYALSLCREWLSDYAPKPVLVRIREIAHALAGAAGIYGFAGISCDSAALSATAESRLAGGARGEDLEEALDRLLRRIKPNLLPPPLRNVSVSYSAATA
jgi:two-component system, OmpR family, response regulator